MPYDPWSKEDQSASWDSPNPTQQPITLTQAAYTLLSASKNATAHNGRRKRRKAHTLAFMNIRDIYEAAGLKRATFYWRLKKMNMSTDKLSTMSLSELVKLINELREK